MAPLASLQFCFYLFICAPHWSSHCTIFFSILLFLVVWQEDAFSLWLCPSTCQKVLLSSSTQSLCERVKGCYKSCRTEVTDCCWSNDCFQFTEECPFTKMLVQESSVLIVVAVVIQSKYHRRGRCSTWHSEGTPRQRRGVVLRLTWVLLVWPLLLLFLGKRLHPTTTFLISSFISHSLSHFFSKMSLAHVDVAPHTLSLGSQ